MASERIERDAFVVRGSDGVVFSNWPIHFAGASLLMRNDSNRPTNVRVHESSDGTTWTLVLLSNHAAAGMPSVTLVGLSFAVVVFLSAAKYVRVSVAADNPEGLFVSMVQFPPKPREGEGEYA